MPKYAKPRTFTQEFKEEAVRLALEGEGTQKEIADRLGVNEGTLREWKAKYRERDDSSDLSPEMELRKLRRENESLKMERDILKKAMVIFSSPRP